MKGPMEKWLEANYRTREIIPGEPFRITFESAELGAMAREQDAELASRDKKITQLVAVATLTEVMMSPNMADQRCAEFGDFSGDTYYPDGSRTRPLVPPEGVETKRCEECTGCSNHGLWLMARAAIAEARGVEA